MVCVNNELEALKKRCADQEIYLEQQSQTINALSKKNLDSARPACSLLQFSTRKCR